VDVAAGINVASGLVVVDFVGFEQEFGGFDLGGAAEVVNLAVNFLGDGADEDFVSGGGIGAFGASAGRAGGSRGEGGGEGGALLGEGLSGNISGKGYKANYPGRR
jgi:hypothetical protein